MFFARLNLIKAHIKAYRLIKKINNDIQIGINQNLTAYQPVSNSALDKIMTRIVRYFDADVFIKPTNKYSDFLGLNYYRKYRIQFKKPTSLNTDAPQNDLGWQINQEGLYQLIKENTKWGKPIYITENGVADAQDQYRPQFIRDAFANLEKALDDKLPIKGYFHWSLLDNFELSEGYTQKFGLHTIDRQPRPSAQVYAALIKKYQQDN